MGQGLHRLSQTHVIGQHAGQTVLPQKLQPGEPLLLVVPQAGPQPFGWGHIRYRAHTPQTFCQSLQILFAVPGDPLCIVLLCEFRQTGQLNPAKG